MARFDPNDIPVDDSGGDPTPEEWAGYIRSAFLAFLSGHFGDSPTLDYAEDGTMFVRDNGDGTWSLLLHNSTVSPAVDSELASYDTATGVFTVNGVPAGSGDMVAATYDPQAIAGDAFDTDNHTDGTTNKVFTATEKTKLSGIETAADVTDATNVAAAGAVMEADTSTASMGFVVDEDGMDSNSATKVPTQQSVKAYVDAQVSGGGYSDEEAQDAVGNILVDSAEINFTYDDAASPATITAVIVSGSIDETKLDTSVNASLDLADSALQAAAIGVSVQAHSAVLDATTASFTTADETKLDGIEAAADVTDATNVNAAGAVMEADYNANTILAATSDNTPVALTVGASTFLGRKASGDISAMSTTEARTLLNVENGATADQSAAEILAALLTVDGAGSSLDADTLDGLSSTAFGRLASTAAWTAAHTWTVSDAGDVLTVVSTEAGGGVGPGIALDRNSASPADFDVLGGLAFSGRNDAAESIIYSRIVGQIYDASDGTEDGAFLLQAYVAGTLATRIIVGDGVQVGSPTGSLKGVGTVNATAVYDDNTLLTCAAMQRAFIERGPDYVLGKGFLDEWDAKVPPVVEPARSERIPVTRKVKVTKRELVVGEDRQPIKDANGNFVSHVVERVERRPVVELVLVYDEDGVTGVDAIEVPVTKTVEHPEKITRRPHHAARVFQRMVADGFDPRDPRNYIARLEADQQLPGMPTEGESAAGRWEHNALSVGELKSRVWLAVEFLALAFRALVAEHDDLAARVAVLESARR